MPAAAKRQKVSVSTKRIALSSSIGTRAIGSYARVSKTTSTAKASIDTNDSVRAISTTCYEEGTTGCKRKVFEDSDREDSITSTNRKNIIPACSKVLPTFKLSPKTPHKQILSSAPSFHEDGTPSKGAASLLNRLAVSSKPNTPSYLSSTFSSSPIDASTPAKHQIPHAELPHEILDLINLHAAFLTAWSLHYAHNGATSPSDLRMLCPDVARSWGKRRVTVDDIRRSLGVMNTNMPEGAKYNKLARLSLSDYGQGKICIEIRMVRGKAGNVARVVNEDLMNDVFVQGLKGAWDDRSPVDVEVKEFIASLPMEPVTTCSSLAKISPLLAKGQRRLEDMKAGITKKPAVVGVDEMIPGAGGAKPTLLERLRAKQLHQSTLPAPPTKAELARRAALQRLEEVIAVLSVLTTSTSVGQSRVSFTMPTVLSKLKDSSRRALSKEEGNACIRLLASEIAPEWIRIIKMGKVEAVVVMREQKPSDLDIRKRIVMAA